jgi:hypothetical protein
VRRLDDVHRRKNTSIFGFEEVKKKVKFSLCLINQETRREDVLGSGSTAPSFLTSALDGGVVSFTPRPFYPRENTPQYLLNRRLGEPQSRPGLCGIKKNLLPLPSI